MTIEEFNTAIAGTAEQRDLQVRQVDNGFTMVAGRRFLDPATGTVRFGLNVEGVAMDTNSLLVLADRFFRTGTFDAPA